MMNTKISIAPRTIPAIAIPWPVWVPPDALIWRSPTIPKTTARIDGIANSTNRTIPTSPRTIDAMAMPLFFGGGPYGPGGGAP